MRAACIPPLYAVIHVFHSVQYVDLGTYAESRVRFLRAFGLA